ncbi:MAG: hypothetical protein II956_09880 [Bacteroidales bacterium]|nr:hypothetical protein [Bacteroidales bacterium]
MKKVFILLLLMISVLTAKSQYYSNSQKFTYSCRNIPAFHTYEDEQVYFINCDLDPIIAKHTNSAKISSLLHLEPWKQTENEDEAFVVINIKMSDFVIDMGAREVVDGFGKRMFTPKGECNMMTALEIKSELDDAIYPAVAVTSGTDVDKLYPEPFLAENFVRDNRDFYERQAVNGQVEKITDEINRYMFEKYLYGFRDDNIRVYFFDSPKNEYYEKHKTAKEEIAAIFKDLSASQDLISARKRMEPWIEHFKSVYSSLDADNKKQSNAKMQMLWNLAVLNYALDYLDLSRQYADDLKAQFPDSEADKIIKQIVITKKTLKDHELTTRFF